MRRMSQSSGRQPGRSLTNNSAIYVATTEAQRSPIEPAYHARSQMPSCPKIYQRPRAYPYRLLSRPHQSRPSDTRSSLRLIIRVLRLLARTTIAHGSRRAEPTILSAKHQLQDPKSSGRLKLLTKSHQRRERDCSSSRFPPSSSTYTQNQSVSHLC